MITIEKMNLEKKKKTAKRDETLRWKRKCGGPGWRVWRKRSESYRQNRCRYK